MSEYHWQQMEVKFAPAYDITHCEHYLRIYFHGFCSIAHHAIMLPPLCVDNIFPYSTSIMDCHRTSLQYSLQWADLGLWYFPRQPILCFGIKRKQKLFFCGKLMLTELWTILLINLWNVSGVIPNSNLCLYHILHNKIRIHMSIQVYIMLIVRLLGILYIRTQQYLC